MMLEIKQLETLEEVSELKKRYFLQATSALDGMWHFGFVPAAVHFGFYEQEALVGYCCINSEGYMLQFYLMDEAKADKRALFTLIAEQNSTVIGLIKGAIVSTAEPQFLSLCLDNSLAFKVTALMYQQVTKATDSNKLDLQLAVAQQLTDFVDFAVASIGAPEQWLTGYFTNLIERKELFGYWKAGKLLASGECRLFDEYQTGYADLGMIVAQSERGQGLATQVLKRLARLANERGLIPICSTENSNIGAQKAIKRAGLSALNRIVKIEFDLQ